MRGCVDNTFSEENVYMVEGVSLLTFCDVSMLQFMPWRKSRFFVLSEGYPTMRVMNIAMGTKAIQSMVSVMCECEFLRRIGEDEDNPIKSDFAYALFYMNITVGVLTVIMDLLVLCLRGSLLREAEMARVVEKSGLEETEHDDKAGDGNAIAKRSNILPDLTQIYGDGDRDDDDDVPMYKNPLHDL
jgi:hypothetical protein